MRLMSPWSAMNGCVYSEFAFAMWPISWTIRRAYGREFFMRSWALRIFEAETISSARVTLRVFCTLLILFLISLPPAISIPFQTCSSKRCLPGTGLLEVLDARTERGLDVLVPGAGRHDLRHQLALGIGEVVVQAFFERQ